MCPIPIPAIQLRDITLISPALVALQLPHMFTRLVVQMHHFYLENAAPFKCQLLPLIHWEILNKVNISTVGKILNLSYMHVVKFYYYRLFIL